MRTILRVLVLTSVVCVAAYAGIASKEPGFSPWPALSVFYMLLGYGMARFPIWPLPLLYAGGFLLWVLAQFSYPPIRITIFYLSLIGGLVLANLAWFISFGGANLRTAVAFPIGMGIPIVLLLAGIKLRGKLRTNGVLIHGGLLFAWFAFGAFPYLPRSPS